LCTSKLNKVKNDTNLEQTLDAPECAGSPKMLLLLHTTRLTAGIKGTLAGYVFGSGSSFGVWFADLVGWTSPCSLLHIHRFGFIENVQ
jgi:hypothetical protein